MPENSATPIEWGMDFGLEVLVFDGKIGGEGLTRVSFGERKMDRSDNTESRDGYEAERKGEGKKRAIKNIEAAISGVENSGLCLLLAWTNEMIQQGSGWYPSE